MTSPDATRNADRLRQILAGVADADSLVADAANETGRDTDELLMGRLSQDRVEGFLASGGVETAQQELAAEEYDVASFGGGSCAKLNGQIARRLGWLKSAFVTNGSDNGGSTQDIVVALRDDYGPTLPVGDITSGIMGLLEPEEQELLNLRKWALDPGRFDEAEQAAFADAIAGEDTLEGRTSAALAAYARKLDQVGPRFVGFCVELLNLSRLVDGSGLIRPGVKSLQLPDVSIRHLAFNALMVAVGAYDRGRKTTDATRFTAGLYLLERALGAEHHVVPASLDEQILYAEWVDEAGEVIWTTRMEDPERPVTALDGQVALSNAPDIRRRLPDGRPAKYGRFGFVPDLPEPSAYDEAVGVVQRLKPGRPIVFGPSSFVASLSPCLAVRGVVRAVAERTDCPRLLVINLTLNTETVGWRLPDYLDFWELLTERPLAETVDYVVVNNDTDSAPEIAQALEDRGDSLETFKFRGPVVVTDGDRAMVTQRGVCLAEAPMVATSRELMRLSSEGEREFVYVPQHDQETLGEIYRLTTDHFARTRAGRVEPVEVGERGILIRPSL